MAESGWQFAADLSELRTVGAVDLPSMAYTFAALNNVVNKTNSADSSAFAWSSGGMSQAYSPWSQLRDSLQNLLGKTSQNLEEAGQAVVQIVQTYADSDSAAKQSLQAAWRDGNTPPLLDGEYPPPGPAPAVVLQPGS
jgi:hypothetical protein